MVRAKKALLSLGAALATKKLVSLPSRLDLDGLLPPMGLARRRTHWGEIAATLGVGLAVGGVVALLVTPSNGKETRARLLSKLRALGDSATEGMDEPPHGTNRGTNSRESQLDLTDGHVSG